MDLFSIITEKRNKYTQGNDIMNEKTLHRPIAGGAIISDVWYIEH